MRKMKTVSYRRGVKRITVTVPDDWLSDKCDACGEEYLEKGYNRLNTHHWKLAYTFDEVKENKELALENTGRFCINHHRVANAIEEITTHLMKGRVDVIQVKRIIDTMPEDMRNKFMELVEWVFDTEYGFLDGLEVLEYS